MADTLPEAVKWLARGIVEGEPALRELTLIVERMTDAFLLWAYKTVEDLGEGWRYPEFVLSDADLERLEARAYGRTLREIDALPELDE